MSLPAMWRSWAACSSCVRSQKGSQILIILRSATDQEIYQRPNDGPTTAEGHAY